MSFYKLLLCFFVGLSTLNSDALATQRGESEQEIISIDEMAEDRVWVDYQLSSVYRYAQESAKKRMVRLLKRELDLYLEMELKMARSALAGSCVGIFRRAKEEGVITVGTRFYQDYVRCHKYKDMLRETPLPKVLMLKAIDALKELGRRGYVLVQEGFMYGEDRPAWDRTGVMPAKTFTKFVANGWGHNLVYIGGSDYSFRDQKYTLNTDLVNALKFLDFTDRYDVKLRSWSPKYVDGSLKGEVVKKTNALIVELEGVDPYFKGGANIRKEVQQNLNSIFKEAVSISGRESERNVFIGRRVREIALGIVQKTVSDKKMLALLSDVIDLLQSER